MPRAKRCRNDEHVWRRTKNPKYERCVKCRDYYPCRFECGHRDCRWVRGQEPDLDFSQEGLKQWK